MTGLNQNLNKKILEQKDFRHDPTFERINGYVNNAPTDFAIAPE